MIYEEDYCELFEQELDRSGENTMKFCELCELQRSNEKMMSSMLDLGEVRRALKE